ncbi:MAG: hypothetical protein KDK39_10950, partial [Leptospiraceae bacterium]|nr:hypothetical protein [Leptospiraceae bacterium]
MTIANAISNGIKIGLKNFFPLLINTILWILTIWIPYLNVGTTIGLIGLIAKMGKGASGLSPTEIFNPDYRKNMGEFFLVMAFNHIGVLIGFLFLVIPAYVIQIAWSQSVFLVLDQNMDPIQAIKKSNEITYGKKWSIFFAQVLPVLGFYIISMILIAVGGAIHEYVQVFFMLIIFIGALLIGPILMGIQAYIYNTLALNNSQ